MNLTSNYNWNALLCYLNIHQQNITKVREKSLHCKIEDCNCHLLDTYPQERSVKHNKKPTIQLHLPVITNCYSLKCNCPLGHLSEKYWCSSFSPMHVSEKKQNVKLLASDHAHHCN